MKIALKYNFCQVEPEGPLSREDFEAIAAKIDPVIEDGRHLAGLIIKTRSFPGWKSLGDVIEHFRFVRDHQRAIDRIALVTDTALASIFPVIVGHFVSAEVRQFAFDDYDQAVAWMRSMDEPD